MVRFLEIDSMNAKHRTELFVSQKTGILERMVYLVAFIMRNFTVLTKGGTFCEKHLCRLCRSLKKIPLQTLSTMFAYL